MPAVPTSVPSTAGTGIDLGDSQQCDPDGEQIFPDDVLNVNPAFEKHTAREGIAKPATAHGCRLSAFSRCNRVIWRRRFVVLLALFSACGSPTAPSSTFAGTWAENFSVPGASLIVTLDASGNGSGTYAIEAGRSGLVQVTGAAVPPAVRLTLRYDDGLVLTLYATQTDANHLSGTVEGLAGSVVFTRR